MRYAKTVPSEMLVNRFPYCVISLANFRLLFRYFWFFFSRSLLARVAAVSFPSPGGDGTKSGGAIRSMPGVSKKLRRRGEG